MAAGQGAVRAARSGPRRSPDHPLIGTGGSPRNFRRPLRSNSTAGNIRKTGGTTSMRTPVIGSLLIVALATGQPAAAAPVSVTREDQREVMVTIYNGNLGLVKDLREVRFPSGQTEVQFMDVAALIDPTTVHLKSITDAPGLKILEQNYEYDLLTSQKLMEKYVGRKVRLYQSDGAYHEATLLSTNGPVFEINGQIHMGHYGRLVLPSLPENLVSKPTLVWLLRNQTARPQRVEASYLTSGITWKADYVMVVDAADKLSDLTGWVTIDNKSGATYGNAYGVRVANQKIAVYFEVKNSKENRRGLPLPKGKIRVYKADASGSQQFIGEDWIDHTPKDESVKIKMGNAFDLVGERTQKDFKKVASNLYEVEWEIALRNHKSEPQTVSVIEPVPGDWQVLTSSHT